MKEHKVVIVRTNEIFTPTVKVQGADIIAEWTGLHDIDGVPIADGHNTSKGEVYHTDGSWFAGPIRLCADNIDCYKIKVLRHTLIPQTLVCNRYYKNNENTKIHVLADVAPDMARCTQICELRDGTIIKVPQGHHWVPITREEFIP